MAVRSLPRAVPVLAVILLFAAAALLLVSRRGGDQDLVLGGPLYPDKLKPADVEGFLLTRGTARYRFERGADGVWRLGGALTDFVDQDAMRLFVNDLLEARGGALLPGTVPEDRRYEFNGIESLRLTLFAADGRRHSLALGVINPVTGTYYASGLDRPGCFPVTEVLRTRLAELPDKLRLRRLLPFFDRRSIVALDLDWGPDRILLRREGERWWLREPDPGLTLGPVMKVYDLRHDDRRVQRDDGLWRLAGKNIIWQLIYEGSELQLERFPLPDEWPAELSDWDLDPPWRRLILHGAAINPDSTEADPDRLEIAFGIPLEGGEVPTLRRGNPMLSPSETGNLLGGALTDLLENTAFTFLVAAEDTLRMSREGALVLAGHRGSLPAVAADAQQRPLSEAWQTDYPTPAMRPDLRTKVHANLVPNMITNLDRLEMLQALPSTRNGAVLAERERVSIEMVGPRGGRRFEVGYLVQENLPDGSPALRLEEGLAPVGLWEPSTGRLLQVAGHLVVTMRNMSTLLE